MDVSQIAKVLGALNQEPEIYLYFGDEERKVKYKRRISGYIVDTAIYVLNSHRKEPFLAWIKEIRGKINKPEILDAEIIEYAKKHKHKIYTDKDIESYLDNSATFIDRGLVLQEERINTEIFKAIINIDKYWIGEEEKQFTTTEKELLQSDWDSEFWRSQSKEVLRKAVNFFRTSHSI